VSTQRGNQCNFDYFRTNAKVTSARFFNKFSEVYFSRIMDISGNFNVLFGIGNIPGEKIPNEKIFPKN
jgi:hypothetical protein